MFQLVEVRSTSVTLVQPSNMCWKFWTFEVSQMLTTLLRRLRAVMPANM